MIFQCSSRQASCLSPLLGQITPQSHPLNHQPLSLAKPQHPLKFVAIFQIPITGLSSDALAAQFPSIMTRSRGFCQQDVSM